MTYDDIAELQSDLPARPVGNRTTQQLKEIIRELTLDEKIGLLYGDGKIRNHGIPRIGLQPICLNNGPRGVRLEDGRTATCLPCGTSLASTFDKQLAAAYGRLLGEECLAAGAQVLEGPGMNLMRSPLCARNFEYFGEDPVLCGKIAAAYIRGCQSVGVAATPKHYALNNQETCRRTVSENVDETTLRELYLRNFEIAVKEGTPWMLMCSYNRINSVHAAENGHLQEEILKGEWNFDGAIVSDWGAVHNAYQCAMNGIDLDMCGGENAFFNFPLKKLARQGLIPMEVIDDHVLRMLRIMDRTGCFAPEKRDAGAINTPEHRKAAQLFAQEGSVLLKNNGILPLDVATCRKIVVCGPSADQTHEMGHHNVCGGSGAVHPEYEITPLQGLREFLPPEVEIQYVQGECFRQVSIAPGKLFRSPGGETGLQATFFPYDAATQTAGTTPILSRIDTEFEQHFGSDNAFVGSNAIPTPLDDLPFSATWTGQFIPPYTGKHTFALFHLNGCTVSLDIHGETVLDSTASGFRDVHSTYVLDAEEGVPVPVSIHFVRPRANGQVSFRLLYETSIPVDFESMRDADAILYFGGSNHTLDREATSLTRADMPADIPDLELPGRQNEFIRKLCEVNPRVIVTLIHGSVLNVEPWVDSVAALLATWYPGQEGGRALAEMLFGKATPNGRLCCTWAKRLQDYACHAYDLFPGFVNAFVPYSEYLERQAVGYRHFDTEGLEVRYPFGFGLSYTTFRQELLECTTQGRQATSRIRITNTGKCPGAAVIQLYLKPETPLPGRPAHELVDFGKIHLEPGESGVLALTVSERDFCHFHEPDGKFLFTPGKYTLEYGTNSRDIFATADIALS